MKIGIHRTPGSFSERWVARCAELGVGVRNVDGLATDVIRQCDGLDAVLWHWMHTSTPEQLVARAVIAALECHGIHVFPGTATCWHYDDKVAQKYLLEAIGAPLIPTAVFTRRQEAMEWIVCATWPKVFKLRCGAGSSNVRLVRSQAEAESLCRRAFGAGFPAVAGYFNDMATRLRASRDLQHIRQRIARAPATLLNRLQARLYTPRQRGYVYFQDYLPGNAFDTRITVIGNRAFGYRRMNRPNDFRASGSGQPRYEPEAIDTRCVRIAFEVAQALGAQSIAFDFLSGPDKTPMIGEISYCFVDHMVHSCPGHWTGDLSWRDGHVWPQDAILDDVLAGLGIPSAIP